MLVKNYKQQKTAQQSEMMSWQINSPAPGMRRPDDTLIDGAQNYIIRHFLPIAHVINIFADRRLFKHETIGSFHNYVKSVISTT